MTLATLLGILSTKLVNRDIGNLFRSLARQANSSFFVFGLLSWHLWSNIDQRLSMRFRSGSWAGQSILFVLCSTWKSLQSLEVYFGSLFSWNFHSEFPNSRQAHGSISLNSISRYWCLSIIPSIKCKLPTPRLLKQPQTIIFWSCFTVPDMAHLSYFSDWLLQTLNK